MSSFVEDVFMPQYYPKLNAMPDRNRGDGFLEAFKRLEQKTWKRFLIIETGCMRPGFSIEGDGTSTKLFDDFVKYYDHGYKGKVISIDITPAHAEYADKQTSENTEVICGDSVSTLWNLKLEALPDLIYLDSYDVDFSNPMMANLHHLKELVACSRLIQRNPCTFPGTIIGVDDCRFEAGDPRVPRGVNPRTVGKGLFVTDFMKDIGAELIFDGYQKFWIVK